MIPAFDPTNIIDFTLSTDTEESTVFKLRRLTGREFIKYKGMLDLTKLDGINFDESEDEEVGFDHITLMAKYYSDNLEAMDYVIEKGLVGWDNFGAEFNDETKLDMLSEQAYLEISAAIVNSSRVGEDEAKK